MHKMAARSNIEIMQLRHPNSEDFVGTAIPCKDHAHNGVTVGSRGCIMVQHAFNDVVLLYVAVLT